MARARSLKVASTPRKRAKAFLDRLKEGLCSFKTVESQWVNDLLGLGGREAYRNGGFLIPAFNA